MVNMFALLRWFGILRTVSLYLSYVNGAYRGLECPSLCRCIKFEGVQGTYCNRTGVTAIPKGIPINTELLEVSYNAIQHLPKDALKGLSNLMELDIGGNGLGDGSIADGALDLPKLVTIDLSYNQFTTIPPNLPENITKLWFMNNGMRTLSRSSLVKYLFLEYLDVSNNQLVKIEPRAFNDLFNLQTLYLDFNNLTDVSFPPNVFTKNHNLQLLGMRFNQIKHLLKNLPMSIRHLDYVGNEIRTLPSYGFQSLPNLQTLAFWQGQVTTIEDNAFYGLSKLTLLDFMQDKISSTLTNNTFAGVSSLQTLYIDLNNISKIETAAFWPFNSISALWLGSNSLAHLEPEVLDEKYLTHLSELYIDFNPWYCDCHLRWLREKVDNATYLIQDPHLITCAGPPKLAGKAWDELKPNDFVC